MADLWIVIAAAGLFGLVILRSGIIALWPDSALADFCEGSFGFLESVGGGDGDCDGDGGGGD